MFRHVVMFSWNDTVDAAHVAAVAAQLDGLVAVIPEIKAYLHGPDAGLNPGNFVYVLVREFDTVDDYLVYRDHPAHQAFIAGFIAGRVASRAAVQYSTA